MHGLRKKLQKEKAHSQRLERELEKLSRQIYKELRNTKRDIYDEMDTFCLPATPHNRVLRSTSTSGRSVELII